MQFVSGQNAWVRHNALANLLKFGGEMPIWISAERSRAMTA